MSRILPASPAAAVAFTLAAAANPAPLQGTPSAPDHHAAIEADWLVQAARRNPLDAAPVTAAADAAGGCDGRIDGTWGFHTAHQQDPWWQVDLGQPLPLDHLLVFNRCDAFAGRANRLQVWLGDDPAQLRLVYQHPGATFLGHADQHPLRVALAGHSARYLRLKLPADSYFHLDEVQVIPAGEPPRNAALGRPATQSSTSEWSKAHGRDAGGIDWPRALSETLRQGGQLAAALTARAVPGIEPLRAAWEQAATAARALPAGVPAAQAADCYLTLRRALRPLVFRHPELSFERILFTKSAPPQFPHLSDQYYGWWSRPGGGLFLIEDFAGEQPRVRPLTDSLPPGSAVRPDLHPDGDRALFAWCRHHPHVSDLPDKQTKANLPEDAFYHLYEIPLDGGPARQLTRGRYDDSDARYLPDGNILFLSTRKGTFLQCSESNTARTLAADLPDSYVRCGGDAFRPVPVFTLHAMTPDGGRIWPLSAFETFEYTPSVALDGRILYCRWDYIDRFNGHFFSLWSTLPDGDNPRLVYGNYTRAPQATMEPRPIPGSHKIIFTAAAHHSVTGGSLVLLDPAAGTEGEAPLTRLTPEVPFPETERNVGHFYANPWPLSEDVWLVSWSSAPLPPHHRCLDALNPVNAQGIYVCDRFGNLELIHRDPAISSMCPIPVVPRPRPAAVVAASTPPPAPAAPVGTFLVQDVYQGLAPVARGEVARLRVVGVPPKVQPNMNQPLLGVSSEETGKFVLGTVPVEPDGSAHFHVPAGVPVFFQALDPAGRAVQTMRSLTYVQPGRTLACIGCHESRQTTPPPGRPSLAARRPPSPLTAGPEGSWPLRFDRLVQPVLDRACLSCHRPGESGAACLLTPDAAWRNLLAFAGNDLKQRVFERDASVAGESPARDCRLLAFLRDDPLHRPIALTTDDLDRLHTWIDTSAQTAGSFSAAQELELVDFRRRYSFLLER